MDFRKLFLGIEGGGRGLFTRSAIKGRRKLPIGAREAITWGGGQIFQETGNGSEQLCMSQINFHQVNLFILLSCLHLKHFIKSQKRNNTKSK